MQPRLVVAACLAATAADTAASTASADATSTASTAGASAEATGAPIVIGMVCSCTGTQQSSLGGADTIAQAWEKWGNTHGGINGHP